MHVRLRHHIGAKTEVKAAAGPAFAFEDHRIACRNHLVAQGGEDRQGRQFRRVQPVGPLVQRPLEDAGRHRLAVKDRRWQGVTPWNLCAGLLTQNLRGQVKRQGVNGGR